jgi:putative transposase
MSMLMDLYSRKIVGWSIDLKMTDSLVIASLRQAIASRQPSPGLVHHTDRGGQYASKEYRKLLARARMQQSMSRAGDCYDNAFMESCFGTIKTELEMTEYNSIEQVGHEIREFVNYYNVSRRHSSLDYQSPTAFEMAVRL